MPTASHRREQTRTDSWSVADMNTCVREAQALEQRGNFRKQARGSDWRGCGAVHCEVRRHRNRAMGEQEMDKWPNRIKSASAGVS
eukprot:4652123-Pleurochrysis_carterae.AAC.1